MTTRFSATKTCFFRFAALALVLGSGTITAFVTPSHHWSSSHVSSSSFQSTSIKALNEEWESDFDDFDNGGKDDDALKLSDVIQKQGANDLSSCRVRQVCFYSLYQFTIREE